MNERRNHGPRPIVVIGALLTALLLIVTACASDEERKGPNANADLNGSPDTASDAVRLRIVASADTPVALTPRPETTDLFVAEQGGRVRRISVSGQGTGRTYNVSDTPTLDISDKTRAQGEQGLLGLAFSPDGAHLYVNFTDRGGDTHIVGYAMDGDAANVGSARELLVIEQPYQNHNGGQLAFGPDGYLYIGVGDGGNRDDPERRAQNADELLGKILRINPLTGDQTSGPDALPYAIPAGNPFASGGGRPEIWIMGARNPWRFSFAQQTGDLWVGDVGQDHIEEINFLPSQPEGAGQGANLGWPYYEGTTAYLDTPPDGATFIEPVATYTHDDGACSISGGYVYRGTAIPALADSYVYGDYCTAKISALQESGDGSWTSKPLDVSVATNSLSSFGQDLDGEIYVLSTKGSIYRIDPA